MACDNNSDNNNNSFVAEHEMIADVMKFKRTDKSRNLTGYIPKLESKCCQAGIRYETGKNPGSRAKPLCCRGATVFETMEFKETDKSGIHEDISDFRPLIHGWRATTGWEFRPRTLSLGKKKEIKGAKTKTKGEKRKKEKKKKERKKEKERKREAICRNSANSANY